MCIKANSNGIKAKDQKSIVTMLNVDTLPMDYTLLVKLQQKPFDSPPTLKNSPERF